MSILKLQNLTIKIRTPQNLITVVDNISFELNKGQTLALTGRSGSGKTLTALAIMGLLPGNFIVSGSIFYDGKNLLKLSEEQRRKLRGNEIAYTLQDQGALNPSLKIKKQLMEKSFGLTLDQAVDLLAQVGLGPEVLKLYPYQLSGGMKQRVLLAIALAQDPNVLIADEPTSGLDTDLAVKVIDLINELKKKRNISTVIISHDLELVGPRADSKVEMYNGRLLEKGSKHKNAIIENREHQQIL